jgi:hypothetical protein
MELQTFESKNDLKSIVCRCQFFPFFQGHIIEG